MNTHLLSLLAERPDFRVDGADKRTLEFFVEYLDHNSLWLLGFEASDDPVFTFTNDAQRYKFSLSEIRLHCQKMKSGVPMDWEHIRFEYISKGK